MAHAAFAPGSPSIALKLNRPGVDARAPLTFPAIGWVVVVVVDVVVVVTAVVVVVGTVVVVVVVGTVVVVLVVVVVVVQNPGFRC